MFRRGLRPISGLPQKYYPLSMYETAKLAPIYLESNAASFIRFALAGALSNCARDTGGRKGIAQGILELVPSRSNLESGYRRSDAIHPVTA